MLPDIIVVDKDDGPETGADLKLKFIHVNEKNAELVIKSLKHFFPQIDFKVMTKEEYKKWLQR